MDWYLPGTKAGGPVRSIHSLINLMKEEYDFYIITSDTDLGMTSPYANIEANTWLKKENVNYYYCSLNKKTPDSIIQVINQLNPQLVYLNSFWSYPFSISIIKAKSKGVLKAPLLLATRGMLGKGALSLKPIKKKIFITLAKICGWYKHVNFHATNVQEKEDILAQFKSASVSIVANTNSGTVVVSERKKNPGQLKLFYLSRIARVKNLHLALKALSKLGKEANIEYDIYGNLEDKNYWEECNAIIKNLPANIKVKYKGELAFNEVQQKISEYHALFLPTLNENFGHSIVESLLCGCIVVVSDQTPWTDINNFGGYALPLIDETEFAKAIKVLALMDENEFKIRSQKSINYISDKLSLRKSSEDYKKLFDGAIKN